MNATKHAKIIIATTALVLPAVPAAAALQPGYAVVDRQHADLGLALDAGQWHLHVHGDDAGELDADAALLVANAHARQILPAVPPAFAFTGATPGQPFWILPQTQDTDVLFLGLGAEEIAPGTLAPWSPSDPRLPAVQAGWIQVALKAVRGPAGGAFSLWQNDQFGNPVVWMSTADGGITPADTAYALEGGHAHFNWGFTQPGLYEIDLEVTAFQGPGQTNPLVGQATYHFGVEQVPEPSSAALLAGAAAVSLLARRRRAVQAIRP
jgi:surface-anchored protein